MAKYLNLFIIDKKMRFFIIFRTENTKKAEWVATLPLKAT